MDFEVIIGIEVHAQLSTQSKLFCGCPTKFGAPPNSQTCPVCLGMPGILPVLNKRAVELAIRAALGLNCEIQRRSVFARKNYFYPDLPKGYQISQYEEPLAADGFLELRVNGRAKKIRIRRVHLEEDAGKSLHRKRETLVDFNRCGVPLIEIVTEPDLSSPQETHLYLVKLRQILQFLGVSSGDMEKGELRCESNLSLRPAGAKEFGVRTEIKNLNSLKAVERSLNFEIERQKTILSSGGKVEQVTLLWNEEKEEVAPMRGKEEAEDYRYFPEPDLPPLVVEDSWVEEIRTSLPELPDDIRERFRKEYGLREADSETLTGSRGLADYYEATVRLHNDPILVSNWILTELLAILKERSVQIEDFPVSPRSLAGLFDLTKEGTISKKIAKEVFAEMVETRSDAREIVEERGLIQITDRSEIESIVDNVLSDNEKELGEYRSGKTQLLGFFVGQVMKRTGGKANPELVNEVLKERLKQNQ